MEQNTRKMLLRPEEVLVGSSLDEVVRQGAQELLQKAVEAEVELFTERYQYLMDDQGRRQVVRNGHKPARSILTGAGALKVAAPRVDDRILEKHGESRFSSAFLPPYLRKSRKIEELLPALYLAGISTGDFSQALEALLGKDATGLSAATIVRLKNAWQQDYTRFSQRDLSGKQYVYWWVDGIYFNARLEQDRPCFLVIIGAGSDGKKELVAVETGFRESAESWRVLLRDLKRRGLSRGAALATGDGSLGFWAALAEVCPETHPQLCWVHKTANVLDKLPNSLQGKAKEMLHDIYLAENRFQAEQAWERFTLTFNEKYPKAVASLSNHREKLLAFYAYPAEHWQHIRSTHVIESSFATVRLRTHRTKGCLSRSTALTMVFKLIESASRRWRRLRGFRHIPDVLAGARYQDGIRVASENLQAVEA